MTLSPCSPALNPRLPHPPAAESAPDGSAPSRAALRPDCGNCFALCCTALGFTRSEDFAVDKPAGSPCRNLTVDFSCGIHETLRSRGFRGCMVFDCFGAGQTVSQGMFAGTSWRADPDSQADMFGAFTVTKQLHEMLWYLIEARTITPDPEADRAVRTLTKRIGSMIAGSVPALMSADVGELRAEVRAVLIDVSAGARASYSAAGTDHLRGLGPGADLMGRNLSRRRLCGADLRGAYLIGADLRESDLAAADLLGADLRDAGFEGADLSGALFLTQSQLNAARGNLRTLLPPDLSVPSHFTP